MTKADLLNAAKGKPSEFTGPDGFTCLLRPLSWGERKTLFDWLAENKDKPGAGLELQQRLITLAVCDDAGAPMLTADDLAGVSLPVAEAIATEVARRNGMDGRAGGEPGKA